MHYLEALYAVGDPYLASVDGICLVLGCICFFVKKQMQSLEALYGVGDPYFASVDGICLVLGCICFFWKEQIQSLQDLNGLGTHILPQWMAFAWYWGAFAFL